MENFPAMMSSSTPTRLPESPLEWAAWAAYLADAKKALNIQVLHTTAVSQMADYFVICTGQSRTQVRAIAEEVAFYFKHANNQATGDERDTGNTWCLLDFGDVIVHVMQEEARGYYQLEKFWSHAEVVPTEDWIACATDMGLLQLDAFAGGESLDA
jgi:ribosome-associated protein